MSVLQLVVEDALRSFVENRIEMPEAMCNEGPKGVLKLHESSDLHDVITKMISLLTHVDDGAAMFNDREDAVKGCKAICDVMLNWGLIVNAGQGGKKSKTEVMFIPFTNMIKEWRKQKKLKVASI